MVTVPNDAPRLQPSRLTRRAAIASAAATAFTMRFGRQGVAADATPAAAPPGGTGSTVHVNGIDLYYEEHGSGRPLLVIPGLGQTAFSLPGLEPRFRCITFDNRGVGRSSVPSGPYTTRTMADDAAALLAQLGVGRAHVFGFSLGGLIAQELALNHPDRVDHVVINGSWARPNHAVLDPWLTTWDQAYARAIDPVAFHLWLLGWLFTPAFMTQADQVAAALAAPNPYPASAQGIAAQTAAIRAHDTLERLGQIGAPTLVLVGAQDIVSPVAYAQILAAGIPAAKLKVLDSGGHAALFEYADAVNAALLTFLTA